MISRTGLFHATLTLEAGWRPESTLVERTIMQRPELKMDAANDLAAKIAAAERERAVWAEGRKGCRAGGIAALNPYSPRSSDHILWAEGFDAERETTKAPEWSR